jgi:hypothetical protein
MQEHRSPSKRIADELSSWPGVDAGTHRFNGLEFRVAAVSWAISTATTPRTFRCPARSGTSWPLQARHADTAGAPTPAG